MAPDELKHLVAQLAVNSNNLWAQRAFRHVNRRQARLSVAFRLNRKTRLSSKTEPRPTGVPPKLPPRSGSADIIQSDVSVTNPPKDTTTTKGKGEVKTEGAHQWMSGDLAKLMVTFDELPKEHQEFHRQDSLEVIQTILSLGFVFKRKKRKKVSFF